MSIQFGGILGFDNGIVLAPMGVDVAGPKLVSAVANAGGIGLLASPVNNYDMTQKAITETKKLTSKPLGQEFLWSLTTQHGSEYRPREISGGITILKHHLAHKKGNIAPCMQVPREVIILMNANLEDIKMKKSSREKEKKATLDACRDEIFGTPYGGGDDDDDDDDNEDDIDIVRRESLRIAAEDEHRRQMYSRSQSVREAGESSGSKSRGGLLGRFCNVFSASGRKQTERSTPASSINLEEEETQFTVPQTMIGDEQLFRRSGAKQKKLKQLWNKNIVDNLGEAAAKLFLHNSIPPHVADSPYFQVFVDTAAEASSGVKVPSSYKIDGKYAKEVYDEIWDYVQGFRKI
ncbi:hypothetical protein ACLOJK_021948 [Asimina triloba]